jgi:hypothetical protein
MWECIPRNDNVFGFCDEADLPQLSEAYLIGVAQSIGRTMPEASIS